MKQYTQSEMDYIHDILIDLIISCMRSGCIPFEQPQVGDWCFECSTIGERNRDYCIGKLISFDGVGKYTTETIGKTTVTWHNAEIRKIPSKFLRRLYHANSTQQERKLQDLLR